MVGLWGGGVQMVCLPPPLQNYWGGGLPPTPLHPSLPTPMGCSGGAMVLGKLPVPERLASIGQTSPTFLIIRFSTEQKNRQQKIH